MKITGHSLLGLVATLVIATQVFANNNASVSSSTTVIQDPRHGSIFSGFVSMSRSTNLYDYQDGSRRDGMDYSMRFNLKLSRDYSVRLDGAYSQDLKDKANDDFSDTSLSFVRTPVALGSALLIGYKLGVVAPTSKDSHIRQNLEGATSGSLIAMINPDRLIPGLAIVSGLSLRKNFHQYQTALDGSVNTEYSSTQSLSLSYDFTSNLSLSADFVHRNGLTYQNNIKEAFDLSQELSYGVTKSVTMAVGHTNSGNMLKPNGQDSNLAVVNDNTSIVYGSATVAF